jgi:hypothetical protein
MVVVPEEFLKVFKQQPQIALNLLRNDELLADRLNKALHQRTVNERNTATQSSENIVNQPPKEEISTVIQGIKESPATPTVALPPSEQPSTSTKSLEASIRRRRPLSEDTTAQRRILKNKLRAAGAWDQTTKEVYNWEGGRIQYSNIDDILSYAFNPEGGQPPLGYKEIARHLKIMNETVFPNIDFVTAIEESRGLSPVRPRTKRAGQRGKGGCCKKRSKAAEPLRWTPY